MKLEILEPLKRDIDINISQIGRSFTQESVDKDIIGAELVIEGKTCIGLNTTLGYIPLPNLQALKEALSNRRLLIIEKISGDLTTLMRIFPPMALYYAYRGTEILEGVEYHDQTWCIYNARIEFRPCVCNSQYDPNKGMRSGWIEVVNGAYSTETRIDIKSPESNPPTTQEIERVFKKLYQDSKDLCLEIKYFSKEGKVAGDTIQTLYPEILFNPRTVPEESFDLWNESFNMSGKAIPQAVTRAKRPGITSQAFIEDLISSHFTSMAGCYIINPLTSILKVLNGGDSDDNNFKNLVSECLDFVSYGISYPIRDVGEPNHYKIKSKRNGTKAVVPTYRPVKDWISKDCLLDLIESGGRYSAIRTIFFMSIPELKPKTYKPYINDFLNNVVAGSRYRKLLTKVLIGKSQSIWYEKIIPLLDPPTAGWHVPYFRPKKWAPYSEEDSRIMGQVKVTAIENTILAMQVLSRQNRRIRQSLRSRGNISDIGVNADEVISLTSNTSGGFSSKNKPGTRMLQLFDNRACFVGDNHKADWLKISDETDGKATKLTGGTIAIRKGLDIFNFGTPESAYKVFGDIEYKTQSSPIGSHKLIFPNKITNADLHKGLYPIPGRYAFYDEEIEEILNKSNEEGLE